MGSVHAQGHSSAGAGTFWWHEGALKLIVHVASWTETSRRFVADGSSPTWSQMETGPQKKIPQQQLESMDKVSFHDHHRKECQSVIHHNAYRDPGAGMNESRQTESFAIRWTPDGASHNPMHTRRTWIEEKKIFSQTLT